MTFMLVIEAIYYLDDTECVKHKKQP